MNEKERGLTKEELEEMVNKSMRECCIFREDNQFIDFKEDGSGLRYHTLLNMEEIEVMYPSLEFEEFEQYCENDQAFISFYVKNKDGYEGLDFFVRMNLKDVYVAQEFDFRLHFNYTEDADFIEDLTDLHQSDVEKIEVILKEELKKMAKEKAKIRTSHMKK